jgi:deazaflavin-dependent oxidoreductase (nitroreductase family)
MADEKIHDSPKGWVASHIDDYVKTGGRKGHRWNGADTLLLTTRGRKTGKLRRTALIYGTDGDTHVVVASYGGAPQHPEWYLNLVAEPRVTIQVGSEVSEGLARTVRGEERSRLWAQMTGIWPDYDAYQHRTERQIPVVVIDPS